MQDGREQLHSEINQIYSLKRRREFVICLGKELAGISSALSMQYSVKFSLKATEKGLLQPKTRHQGKKKTDANFVKEAKIENAAPAIRTFASYLHGLLSLMG